MRVDKLQHTMVCNLLFRGLLFGGRSMQSAKRRQLQITFTMTDMQLLTTMGSGSLVRRRRTFSSIPTQAQMDCFRSGRDCSALLRAHGSKG